MGAKGSKVQKITTDFNVQIKFPDKAIENGDGAVNGDNSCNIIKITGKKDNCEKASQALLELVPITAEVSVPFEFHRLVDVALQAKVRNVDSPSFLGSSLDRKGTV